MKYLKLLEERQLNVSDLQKAVQKKIGEIENLASSVNELKQIVDLDDEDRSTLADLEEAISSLDEYLARKIEIFNPETYAKKLEVVKNAQSKRKNLSADKEVEPEVKEIEVKEVEKEQEKQQEQYEQQDESEQYDNDYYYEDDEEEEQAKVVEMPNKVEAKKAILQKKLDDLKQSVTVRDEHFEDGGENEFDKVENVKPKKLTTPLIIMGIGALILTVGAVNFFKRR